MTNVSANGFRLLLGHREVFLSFETFPWFRDATIGQLLNVEWPSDDHLRWPDLDVDLAVESIEHPERYPLVSAARPNRRSASVRDSRRRVDARASEPGKSGGRGR